MGSHDTHWLKENLTASQTNATMSLLGYTTETEYVCPFPLIIARLKAVLTEPRTAGTLTITIMKNGVALAIPAPFTFDATNPQLRDIVLDPSLATLFQLGDRLKPVITTDAAWLPVTSDLLLIPTLARPYGP